MGTRCFINNYMYYTIYKTTNKVNGKFYIGCHKTKDLNDGYLGSGKLLKRAIEKYGKESFTKETLFVFDNPEDMFTKEGELVNEDFLSEENTYNLKVGGFGGWDHENYNSEKQREKCLKGNEKQRWLAKNDPNWKGRENQARSASRIIRRLFKEGRVKHDNFKGKEHTEEAKKKIGKANSKYQSGKGNSQYGTMWIHNTSLKKSKRIKRTENIPEGWVKGAKFKWN